MSELLELYGDPLILSVGGLFIGGLFGFIDTAPVTPSFRAP
ncbi:MAG: hypothetical protein ACO35I_01150 [Burkholderiaceae bacterium]|jgi:hypothetical protein